MNNDLSEDENEKNFQSWGTTSDSEHSAPISERIIEMEEFEFMDPSLIEVTKIPGLDYKSGRNENKKSESSYESLHKSKFYEFETSNDKFDESLIQNISQSMCLLVFFTYKKIFFFQRSYLNFQLQSWIMIIQFHQFLKIVFH